MMGSKVMKSVEPVNAVLKLNKQNSGE